MSLPEKEIKARITLRAKVTIGDTEFQCESFDPQVTDSVDTVEIRTVGAAKTAYLPGAVTNTASVEVKVLQDGTAAQPAVGSRVQLKIEKDSVPSDGTAAVSSTTEIPCFVQQVSADKIEASGGSRKEAWTITLQPTNLPKVAPVL